LKIYYVLNEKEKAIGLIKKYKNDSYDNELLNIISLWLGDHKIYHNNREFWRVHDAEVSYLYLQETLVHFQYNWVVNLFVGNTELKEKYEPLFFAAIMLEDPKLDINSFIPESMIETVQNILNYVKERQEFYYGK
jgi:hypothetical protein